MNCNDAQKRLDALLNGTLPTGERFGVQAHVNGCDECSQMLTLLRLDGEHPVQFLRRLATMTLFHQHESQVVPRRGVVGTDLERLAIDLLRLCHRPSQNQEISEIVEDLGVVRILRGLSPLRLESLVQIGR